MPRVLIRDPVERFWSWVNKDGPEKDAELGPCWEWTGSCNNGSHPGKSILPYGKLSWNQKTSRAHRVSWEIHFGPIPEGMKVLHRCDNPPCVRPDHLFLGTDAANNADKKAKGRSYRPKGLLNSHARVNEAMVVSLRDMRKKGWTTRQLSELTGIQQSTVRQIVYYKTWRHLA